MRVAYLSTDPGIAFGGTKGASVHIGELTAALAAEGADVLVLVEPVETLPGPGKGAPAADRIAAEPELRAWLEERLRGFGADALYERLALHSAAGSAVARSLGIPHVVELNARLRDEAGRYRRLDMPEEAERLERRTLEHADLVLAVSRPLAEYAHARGARRVEVLPNAVSPDRFAPGNRNEADPVAVFLGTLRPWHGIDTIAEAWTLLGDDAPRLLVVGDGPGRTLLEAAGARVTGAVSHAQVPALLAGADIALAPYAADAPDYFSPLKLFEYLAAGLATIASDLPGVRDVVTEETALLVPRGDPYALVDAVAILAADVPRRRRLGEAGRDLVVAEHTWSRRASRILDLVAELTPAEAHV